VFGVNKKDPAVRRTRNLPRSTGLIGNKLRHREPKQSYIYKIANAERVVNQKRQPGD